MIAASALIVAVMAVSPFLTRRSAAERHLIWMTTIVLAAALPRVSALVPQWQPGLAWRAASAIPFFSASSLRDTADAGDIIVHASAIDAPFVVLRQAALLVWLGGIALFLCIFLRASRRLARYGARAQPIEDAAWLATLDHVSRVFGIKRPIQLLLGPDGSVPVTWGVWHSRIVMPAQALTWQHDRVQAVLAHELAHTRRADWMTHLFAKFACAIYWFNPLFWIAYRRLCLESERACDDAVVAMGIDRRDYAVHLFEIARELTPDRTLGPALAMAKGSTIERRFTALLSPSANRQVTTPRFAAAVVLGLLALTLPLAAMRLPEMNATIRLRTAGLPAIQEAPDLLRDVNVVTAIRDVRTGGMHSLRDEVTAPEVIAYTAPPLYSDEARTRKIEGTVTLEVHVDAAGHADVRRVVKGLGFGLDDNARLALRHWQFSPATRHGVPVDSITDIDIAFNLANEALNESIANDMATRVGPGVTPPRIIRRVAARNDAGTGSTVHTGSVVLDIVLLEDGTPKVVRIVRSLDGDLDREAIRAFEQWRFSPAMKDGVPVKVRLDAEVTFREK